MECNFRIGLNKVLVNVDNNFAAMALYLSFHALN